MEWKEQMHWSARSAEVKMDMVLDRPECVSKHMSASVSTCVCRRAMS